MSIRWGECKQVCARIVSDAHEAPSPKGASYFAYCTLRRQCYVSMSFVSHNVNDFSLILLIFSAGGSPYTYRLSELEQTRDELLMLLYQEDKAIVDENVVSHT